MYHSMILRPFQNLTFLLNKFDELDWVSFGVLWDVFFFTWFVLITDMGFWNLTALIGQPSFIWRNHFVQ